MTDSTSLGFLVPTDEGLSDDALHDVLQATIVGITALPGSMVRPRWQPNPPNQPEATESWVAFGIVSGESDWDAAFVQVDDADGGHVDGLRGENSQMLVSFYGPRAGRLAARLRAGLAVDQNRDLLRANKITIIGTTGPTTVPALLRQTWVPRVDITVTIHRDISTSFPIRTIIDTPILNDEIYPATAPSTISYETGVSELPPLKL